MTDDEQKKIFSKNLTKYISLNQKQQIDVANDLGIKATTFNMWCTGNSLPNTGKIRALADYFKIGMTDLTDEKDENDSEEKLADILFKIALNDKRFAKIIISYSSLPSNDKNLICDFFEKFIFKE